MVAYSCNNQTAQITNNMMGSYQELGQLTNETLSVVMQSASAMTKGCEEIFSNLSTLMKSSMENNLSATKTIFGAKSFQEAMTAQASLMKSNTDYTLTQISKLSQLSSRVAQEALTPVTDHMNTAWTKVTSLTNTNMCKAA